MKARNARFMMAAALAAIGGDLFNDIDRIDERHEKKIKEVSEGDIERINAAEAKRKRKAAKNSVEQLKVNNRKITNE